MDDEEEFTGRLPSRKFQKIDVLMVGLNLVGELFTSIGDAFESLAMLTASQANLNVDQERFHREAALEIEKLTGEQDG